MEGIKYLSTILEARQARSIRKYIRPRLVQESRPLTSRGAMKASLQLNKVIVLISRQICLLKSFLQLYVMTVIAAL
jgi:hypothetical protein